MSSPAPVPPKPPHPGEVMKQIRKLATEGRFSYGTHVFDERSPERGIDIPDAVQVLKKGMIKGEIKPGVNPGEWICKVVDQADGSSRWIGVVVAATNNWLFMMTVEWEDRI
jgi:hypothetical protein